MKKNDLIKTEDGIYRILSIEANRVLAIDCIKKTMPKFYKDRNIDFNKVRLVAPKFRASASNPMPDFYVIHNLSCMGRRGVAL